MDLHRQQYNRNGERTRCLDRTAPREKIRPPGLTGKNCSLEASIVLLIYERNTVQNGSCRVPWEIATPSHVQPQTSPAEPCRRQEAQPPSPSFRIIELCSLPIPGCEQRAEL